MARLAFRIDCSPNELRRLAGRPDLLPLYEVLAVALERRLVQQVAAVDVGREGSPKRPAAESNGPAPEARQTGVPEPPGRDARARR